MRTARAAGDEAGVHARLVLEDVEADAEEVRRAPSAATSAASSTMAPRAVLTRTARGFMRGERAPRS